MNNNNINNSPVSGEDGQDWDEDEEIGEGSGKKTEAQEIRELGDRLMKLAGL